MPSRRQVPPQRLPAGIRIPQRIIERVDVRMLCPRQTQHARERVYLREAARGGVVPARASFACKYCRPVLGARHSVWGQRGLAPPSGLCVDCRSVAGGFVGLVGGDPPSPQGKTPKGLTGGDLSGLTGKVVQFAAQSRDSAQKYIRLCDTLSFR